MIMRIIRTHIAMMALLAGMISGCDYLPEHDIPDICGLYRGTIVVSKTYAIPFLVDILSIDQDGVSGVTVYESSSSSTTYNFSGEWNDEGSGVDIVIEEIRSYGINTKIAGNIDGGVFSGNYYTSPKETLPFTLRKVSPSVTPADPPDIDVEGEQADTGLYGFEE